MAEHVFIQPRKNRVKSAVKKNSYRL